MPRTRLTLLVAAWAVWLSMCIPIGIAALWEIGLLWAQACAASGLYLISRDLGS